VRLLPSLPSWNRLWAVPYRRQTKSSARSVPLRVEALEERALLTSYTPLQIRHAYGFDRVGFEDATHSLVAGDGSGETIAVVDAYDDPNIAGDLAHFDSTYGLPAPPSFTKVSQTGSTIFPAANRGWSPEIALDVEYAHAMAPGASLLLVEANDNSLDNLLTAARYAASQPGVAVVSMSWGGSEDSSELSDDSSFVTPSGHEGVTFVSSSGDTGGATSYPATSPNVVAVGGTTLLLDSQGNYLSESGWSDSGGGISQYESQPAYQNGVVTQSSTRRTVPDIAFDANPSTGVLVYDTYGRDGSYSTGGTSLAAPIMAGLAAIADQGRSYLLGQSSYDSVDFLTALYDLPQSDFNDITTGSTRYPAGPGYDLVTGRGSAIVDRFVAGMIGAPVYNPLTGALLVTGGGRGSNDTITLSENGGQLVVEISTDTPLAGSDIPPDQTFTFNSDQYSSVSLAPSDGTTAVVVDDSADTADETNITLSNSRLTGLALGTINFGTSGVTSLTIMGGDGNNVYTVTGTPASQATTLNTGGGTDTINVLGAAGTGTLTIVGGGGNVTLAGSNQGNTFALSGNDSGTLSGSAYGNSVLFSQIDNLTGGAGGDTFQFADQASLSGNITSGGNATLDYSAYSTSVIVDLQTGIATGVGGTVSGIATVDGGSAGPATSGEYNLLIGAGGNILNGGVGRRNILVAGTSASTLNAGDGEDLLIGGSTAYDTDLGLSAWLQIAAYWAGSDDYATRVANLTSGNGVPLLDATVVTGNGGGNTLNGSSALAMLYTDGSDAITDFDPNSQEVVITP
jgi:hypothetical protein